MTEAWWTRATDVTQPGWYWLRRVGSLTVVQVIAVPGYEQRHWIVEGVNLRWSLGNMDGEFLGPISLDSYKQGRVAGIKAVRRKITDLIDRGFTDYEEDMDDLIEWIDFQLAQQAQDKKGVGDAEN